MRKIMLFLVFALLVTADANAEIISKTVDYADGDVKLKGTLVYDDAVKTAQPGILLVPEWWGHNEYIKTRAKEMASKGYVAFAVDMYGDGKTTEDAKQANEWATPFYTDRKMMRSRAEAGLKVLKDQENVDKNNIAVIGFCFGGTVALELARSGEDIKGVGTFHAGLQFSDKPGKDSVKAKLLVMNGAADPMVSYGDAGKFITEMEDAHADLQFIDYSGAIHAFTNRDADRLAKQNGMEGKVGYNALAEKRSFAALDSFLKEIFSK